MKSVLLATSSLVLTLSCEAAAGSLGTLFPQIVYTSDYRYDGLSNSNNEPTVQASLYLWRPDDFYAGVSVLGVDYGYPGSPTYEIDIYGGRKQQFGKIEVSLEAMVSVFPDQSGPGPTLNFNQAKTGVKYADGALTLGGAVAWSPQGSYGGGETSKPVGTVSLQITDWLSFSGKYGTVISQKKQDRKFWDVGATAKWNQVAFDIRYIDTDLERHQCFYTSWCEPSIVGTITWNVPILGFSKL